MTKETPKLTVQLEDGKTQDMTAEDVANLIKQQASATNKTKAAAPFLKLAEKFNADPDKLAEQSEAALIRLMEGQEMGLVDEDFNWVKKDPSKSNEPDPTKQDPEPNRNFNRAGTMDEERMNRIMDKALKDQASKYEGELEKLKRMVGSLTEFQVQNQIQSKFPALSAEDCARVMATARKDSSKSLLEHAEAAVEGKKAEEDRIFQARAEKEGIDLEKIKHRNELKEQGAGGGGKLPMFEGKKVTLTRRPGAGDNQITAEDAIRQHFAAKEAAQGG